MRTVQDADNLEHHLPRAPTGVRVVSRPRKVVHRAFESVLERLSHGRQVALDRVVLRNQREQVSPVEEYVIRYT